MEKFSNVFVDVLKDGEALVDHVRMCIPSFNHALFPNVTINVTSCRLMKIAARSSIDPAR
jgi:hypothetical protein